MSGRHAAMEAGSDWAILQSSESAKLERRSSFERWRDLAAEDGSEKDNLQSALCTWTRRKTSREGIYRGLVRPGWVVWD